MYTYRAKLVRVIDGDTLEMDIDLGFDVHVMQTIRMLRINAPELHKASLTQAEKERGQRSKEHLEMLLTTSGELTVETTKDRSDKYGRYLADIFGTRNGVPVNLNLQMVADGHAVPMKG